MAARVARVARPDLELRVARVAHRPAVHKRGVDRPAQRVARIDSAGWVARLLQGRGVRNRFLRRVGVAYRRGCVLGARLGLAVETYKFLSTLLCELMPLYHR